VDGQTETDRPDEDLIAFRNFAKVLNENESAKNLRAEWKEHSLCTLCAVIHVILKYRSPYILGRLFFKTYVTVKLREISGVPSSYICSRRRA
jgi:hypothetical protein